MSKVFLSAISLALLAASAYADVTVVGAYSNRVVTDVRAQGYDIQLWKDGDQYFGFFLSAGGLADNIPLGTLDNLRVDPTAKTISFQTKMSVGRSSLDGETWEPTRDMYQFSGTLFPDQISGDLVHVDELLPDTPATHEDVKLYRNREEEQSLPTFTSYQQWLELSRKLMATRGPKW